jgi:hypothetical protein
MTPAPLIYTWNGAAMMPLSQFMQRAQRQFTIGQRYRLEIIEERSSAAHRSYFAAIREAWHQLRESDLAEYPTETHLRKKLLIKCGFADERSITCASEAEARRVASFIKPLDSYAVIVHSGDVVKVFTAKSQSQRAMNKEEFNRSADAVRIELDKLIGVERGELEREGMR